MHAHGRWKDGISRCCSCSSRHTRAIVSATINICSIAECAVLHRSTDDTLQYVQNSSYFEPILAHIGLSLASEFIYAFMWLGPCNLAISDDIAPGTLICSSCQFLTLSILLVMQLV